MSGFVQFSGLLAILGLVVGWFTLAFAEPPISTHQLTLPPVESDAIAPPPAADTATSPAPRGGVSAVSPAEESIRRALQGDLPAGAGAGLLGGVLDVIQERRSILDGSSLDLDADLVAAKQPPGVSISRRARAAEQLLRASRLLENLGRLDEDRAALVNRMRAEAGRLISE